VVFAGNASSRCRSNRLIPAYRASMIRFQLSNITHWLWKIELVL